MPHPAQKATKRTLFLVGKIAGKRNKLIVKTGEKKTESSRGQILHGYLSLL